MILEIPTRRLFSDPVGPSMRRNNSPDLTVRVGDDETAGPAATVKA